MKVRKIMLTPGWRRVDVVYDLGSGDGRIVILAARRMEPAESAWRSTPSSCGSPVKKPGVTRLNTS
jgi:hypothetical protein